MAHYLYIEIKNYLMQLIRENKDTPNYMLPSENQLALKFSTTRVTAKRALNELQEEGYIYRKHGKGSFINLASVNSSLPQTNDFVCMLLPNIDSIFISRIVAGAREYLARFGFSLLIMTETEERLERFNLISELTKIGIRGIIVFPNTKARYNKELLLLALKNFPIVFVDRYMEDLDISSVSSRHAEAGNLAVNLLTERGCKNIGFISAPSNHASSVQERISGYKYGLTDNRILIHNEYILEVSKQENTIDKRIEEYFHIHPEIDGLLSYGDIIGIHVYQAIRNLRIRVPDQMKVIFLDDEYSNYADILPFSPSCIVQQSSEIGRQAAALLVKYINGQGRHDEKIQISYKFIERASTRKP